METLLSVLAGVHPEVGWLDHMVFCLTYWGTAHLFAKAAATLYVVECEGPEGNGLLLSSDMASVAGLP